MKRDMLGGSVISAFFSGLILFIMNGASNIPTWFTYITIFAFLGLIWLSGAFFAWSGFLHKQPKKYEYKLILPEGSEGIIFLDHPLESQSQPSRTDEK